MRSSWKGEGGLGEFTDISSWLPSFPARGSLVFDTHIAQDLEHTLKPGGKGDFEQQDYWVRSLKDWLGGKSIIQTGDLGGESIIQTGGELIEVAVQQQQQCEGVKLSLLQSSWGHQQQQLQLSIEQGHWHWKSLNPENKVDPENSELAWAGFESGVARGSVGPKQVEGGGEGGGDGSCDTYLFL